MRILENAQAVIKGHFVLKSGLHSRVYVNKDAVYTDPETIAILGMDLGQPFCDRVRGEKKLPIIDVVVGPAIGGVILAHCVGKHIAFDRKGTLRALFADKEGKSFIIRRGYDKFVTGKNVLVVEDIITTGESVIATVKAVELVGGIVQGVAAICNRGKKTAADLGVPELVSLVEMEFATWTHADCPACREGELINTEVGHGKTFVAEHGQPKAA